MPRHRWRGMNFKLRDKDGLKGGFKNYLIAAVMLVALCSLAIAGRAKISEKTTEVKGITSVDPNDFEPLRASVVDDSPSNYTIDVRKFSNIGVNEEAPSPSISARTSLNNAAISAISIFLTRNLTNTNARLIFPTIRTC